MCTSEFTYNVRITSIWGWHYVRKTPYYSFNRALYGLQQRMLLNEELKERYNNGRIVLELIHFENGQEIGKQSINLKFN